MSIRVDHLVWYAPDLEAGTEYFARLLGCEASYGGAHPGQGTQNSLLSLGDETYLEILARDPAQAAAGIFGRELAAFTTQGLYHWAVAGLDLERLVERARRASLDCSEVITGGRLLPDGRELEWRLAGLRNHEFGALVPFFIDWGSCEHPASSAPSGGRLAGIELVSPVAARLTRLFEELDLSFPVRDGPAPSLVATLEGRSGRHRLRSIDPLPKGFEI